MFDFLYFDHSTIPWFERHLKNYLGIISGSARKRRGSFQGRDHFGVGLGIISGAVQILARSPRDKFINLATLGGPSALLASRGTNTLLLVNKDASIISRKSKLSTI